MFGRIVCPLAVLVIVCVLRPGCVVGQCTTERCSDDHGDGTDLAVTVLQLKDSVERLQQQVVQQNVILTKQEGAIEFLLKATCCSYAIYATTGTAEDAALDRSRMYSQLYRGDVTTGWHLLDTPVDDFKHGKTDRFPFTGKCITEPCVRLKHVTLPPATPDLWFCTTVQLKVKYGCQGEDMLRLYNYTFNVGFLSNVESRCPE
ncbi:hypothetical protein LSAT2_001519 [Lamellibrachia satsuma]|nr:hypothetical protein LSAT2_001519 [Lamellibrachia satsuma]